MSRIGKLPIEIPAGVEIKVSKENLVTVKGSSGELTQQIDPEIELSIEDNNVTFKRVGESKRLKSMHGLYRSLVNNMVIGVSKGFEIKLELVGVGYRAELLPGNILDLVLGFAHHIYLQIPPEVKVEAVSEKRKNPIVTLSSTDKQLVGQVAAKIRSFRKPEPYKGKGVKFVGEVLRRKAGKAAAK
ncbi:MAG: 50S ribosomal protein L6 [Prolixibacteraceae bacterium]|jgi:large subunit ribosomal protein L6|nr:50S ribosomal protein L6 [Prolixibacteraceae bacterium]MBT6767080.1 50S ribosomal protein L6 [Prolixibacteraceae bacterium]MBT6998683.1 50S ribosomal protein L6 [Prolixibacteraceae bacterium]MBT7397484.1 50S ribosomal protein L6 [Prolixibacteraceae bacterium]